MPVAASTAVLNPGSSSSVSGASIAPAAGSRSRKRTSRIRHRIATST